MDSIGPTTGPTAAPPPPARLHPRREPFDHGLVPIPNLVAADPAALRDRLLARPIPDRRRLDAAALADALHLSAAEAALVLDVLASILPSSDPEPSGACVIDLVLFVYIQNYKRLLQRTHSASMADVWPATSAFDGCISALSRIQLVRSNSRRLMPSQADEEVHQLSYLQKHMANILDLLAESVEGEGDESLVLTMERFEHLGFLIQFTEKDSEGIPLRQATPFFASSDPNMPAVHVPAAQVHDWLLQNIVISLEHTTEKASAKENGLLNPSDDVNMADAHGTGIQRSSSLSGTSMHNNPAYSRSQTLVEGFSRTSVVKHASDIKAHSLKVLNCHDSVIYILAPLTYATVYGCSDATIVLGAIGKALKVEHCERVQVLTATKRICIANCRDCVFFLGVNQQPLILGDNHNVQVAPFNTYYSQLEEHLALVGVDPAINRWDEPMVLGMVVPHDSLTNPTGISDIQAESPTCLDPEQFTNFSIPNWFGSESLQSITHNPFPLPETYGASQTRKHSVFCDIQQAARDVQLDEKRKRELASALHIHFKDWLYASGNIRQLYCLQGDRTEGCF